MARGGLGSNRLNVPLVFPMIRPSPHQDHRMGGVDDDVRGGCDGLVGLGDWRDDSGDFERQAAGDGAHLGCPTVRHLFVPC